MCGYHMSSSLFIHVKFGGTHRPHKHILMVLNGGAILCHFVNGKELFVPKKILWGKLNLKHNVKGIFVFFPKNY